MTTVGILLQTIKCSSRHFQGAMFRDGPELRNRLCRSCKTIRLMQVIADSSAAEDLRQISGSRLAGALVDIVRMVLRGALPRDSHVDVLVDRRQPPGSHGSWNSFSSSSHLTLQQLRPCSRQPHQGAIEQGTCSLIRSDTLRSGRVEMKKLEGFSNPPSHVVIQSSSPT